MLMLKTGKMIFIRQGFLGMFIQRETNNGFKKNVEICHSAKLPKNIGCSFLQSGETVINADDLERMKNLTKPPKYKTGFDRNYWIWQEPKDGVSYIISADVARGDSTDFSVFHVINLVTRRTSC